MGETEIPIYIAKDLPTVTDSLIQSIIHSFSRHLSLLRDGEGNGRENNITLTGDNINVEGYIFSG